jgi:hypothetical protein
MIDFFSEACKEPARRDAEYGLIDNITKYKRAFSAVDKRNEWIATVKNKFEKSVVFVAIDGCISIKKENSNDDESLCDGLLLFDDALYLVELKNQQSSWFTTAKAQLTNTIRLLNAHHSTLPKRRKAFACNKAHGRFQVIENAKQKRFYEETGFRIDKNATITVN